MDGGFPEDYIVFARSGEARAFVIFGPPNMKFLSQIWQRVGRKGTGLKGLVKTGGDRYLDMNPTVVEARKEKKTV